MGLGNFNLDVQIQSIIYNYSLARRSIEEFACGVDGKSSTRNMDVYNIILQDFTQIQSPMSLHQTVPYHKESIPWHVSQGTR